LKRQKFDIKAQTAAHLRICSITVHLSCLDHNVPGFTLREEVSVTKLRFNIHLYSKSIDIGPDILKLFRNVTRSVSGLHCTMNCSRYNAAQKLCETSIRSTPVYHVKKAFTRVYRRLTAV